MEDMTGVGGLVVELSLAVLDVQRAVSRWPLLAQEWLLWGTRWTPGHAERCFE